MALHAHFQKPQIIGYRKNGCPIWSIAGAEDGGQPAGQPAGASTATPPAPQDNGFPANTPIEQMTGEQRENYWKHQARKHEDRVKAFGGLTADELAQLREKAGKHDAMERDLMGDHEKALAQATESAAADVAAVYVPRLVNAELRAAAAGSGVSAETLQTALEYVDEAKFLNDKGEDVDPDKVARFIAGIAPATGTNLQIRRGPTATTHAGNGSGTQPVTGRPGESGRAMAEKRFGKKTTTTT